HFGEEHLVAGGNAAAEPGDLLGVVAAALQRQAHQVAQQLLAQRKLLRRDRIPDDQAGGGAAAHVQDRELPVSGVAAGQVADGNGGCAIDDTVLAISIRTWAANVNPAPGDVQWGGASTGGCIGRTGGRHIPVPGWARGPALAWLRSGRPSHKIISLLPYGPALRLRDR